MGTYSRILPTAGVCDQHLGASLRLLLTAGVCAQRLGGFLRLLLTAGVCEQRLGASLRLLLTAGVCHQHLGMSSRLLHKAGVSLYVQGTPDARAFAHCWAIKLEGNRNQDFWVPLESLGQAKSVFPNLGLCFCKSICEIKVATFCYFWCEYCFADFNFTYRWPAS